VISPVINRHHQPPIAPGLEILDWADIPALVELEEILFPGDAPWTYQMFAGELEAGCFYVVHRDQDGLVDGYAGMAMTAVEAEVHTIGVRPAAQGAGLGRKLLRQLISAAGDRRLLLEVRTDNAAAIALYVSEGFTTLGVRRRYYEQSGADAFTMARPK
jgi:ribosomal-protein-alanine N-acetyltransferase